MSNIDLVKFWPDNQKDSLKDFFALKGKINSALGVGNEKKLGPNRLTQDPLFPTFGFRKHRRESSGDLRGTH